MKRIIIFIVTLMGACCRLAVAQESPPPSQYLKSVNAQFYIDSRDSSVWHFKGATYGWEKLGRYKDVSAKLNISDTTFLLKKADAANMYGKLTGTNHFSGLNYFNNGNSQMLIDGASMSGNLGRVVFGGTSPFVQTYAGLPYSVFSGSGTGGIIFQNDSLRDSQGNLFVKYNSGNIEASQFTGNLTTRNNGSGTLSMLGPYITGPNGAFLQFSGVTNFNIPYYENHSINGILKLRISDENNNASEMFGRWTAFGPLFANQKPTLPNAVVRKRDLDSLLTNKPDSATIANSYFRKNQSLDLGNNSFSIGTNSGGIYASNGGIFTSVPAALNLNLLSRNGFVIGGISGSQIIRFNDQNSGADEYGIVTYQPTYLRSGTPAVGDGQTWDLLARVNNGVGLGVGAVVKVPSTYFTKLSGDNNFTGNQNIDGNISLTGNLTTGNDISANNVFVPNTVSFGVLYKSLPSSGYFAIANDISANDVDIRSSSGAGQVRGIRLKGDGSVFIGNVANNTGVTVRGNNLDANDIQAAGLLVSHYNGTTSIAGNGIFNGSNSLNFDGDGSWRFTAPVKLPSAYPTDPLHAVPKVYVDNAITGLFWKNAVRVRTTSNITLSGLQTIDGQAGGTYRVLVNAQTNPTENGIYDQKSGAWTRAIDADTGDEIWGSTVMVTNGTLYRNTQWTNINTSSPVIATDAVTYGQISGAGTYSSSSGINLSANVFTLDQTFTRGLFSSTSPLSYNSVTGAFGIAQASGSQDGYLSAANWTTFNSKQNSIALPAGQVGYSDGSTLVGSSNLVWDNTNGTLKLGAGTADANAILKVTAASGSKGMVVGTSAYPSWMGANGLYVDANFRAGAYFVNSGGEIKWGGSGARIGGISPDVGQNSYLYFGTGGGAPFATYGERMRITDDGKIGIGITTPLAILHTAGGASAQNTVGAFLQNTGGTAANTSVSLDFTNTTATTGQIAQGRIASIRTNRVASGDADLAFYTLSNNNLLERLRITNGNFGFLTSDPTHTITLGSASTGLAFYRTANQTTDFERVLMSWNGTTFQIQSDNLGTGVTRNLAFGAGASTMTFSSAGINNAAVEFKRDNSAISNIVSVNSAGLTGTSVQSALSIYPTINQNNAAAGGYNGLFISPFEQSLGTGTKYLINAGLNNAANGTGVHDLKFGVDNVGQIITSSTGSHLFNNTANATANYERGLIQWQSNALTFGTYYGGTAGQRSLQIGVQQSPGTATLANGRILTINPNPSSTAGMFDFTAGTTGTGNMTSFRSSLFATSGTQSETAALTTINQSGTAGYNISYMNVTETSTGSGAKMLARWEVGGSGKFSVDNNGNTQITGAITSAGRRANVTAVKTANYSATFSDEIIQCNSSTGSFNVTLLPSAPIGTIITIDNVDGTANSVTVIGTINGVTNYTLNALKTVTLYKTATGTNTWKFHSNIN